MALARFFSRAATAIGQHLSIGRDDLENFLEQTLIEVHFGEDCLKKENAYWTASLLINIVSRLYPRLALSGQSEFTAEMASVALGINPDIELVSAPQTPSVKIAIGTGTAQPAETLCPGSSGWVASLVQDGTLPLSGPPNPYAASFAAGLAAAETFRRIFSERLEDHHPIGNVRVSLLDFSENSGVEEVLGPMDIGDVAFCGLGAVGNAAIWVLSRHEGLTGRATLIDHETIELSNLQRYVLALDADENVSKPELAMRAFATGSLSVEPQPLTLCDYSSRLGDRPIQPTVCVSVDNFHDRRVAQALLPRLVVNGYTGKTDLGASWHYFDNDKACLACLYFREQEPSELNRMVSALGLDDIVVVQMIPDGKVLVSDHLRIIEKHRGLEENALAAWEGKHIQDVYSSVTCGNLGIAVNGQETEVVPLAHQSVLAGVLMASELVKRTTSLAERSQAENLANWPNILKSTPKRWCYSIPPTKNCICSDDDYLNVYKEKWSSDE
ncbi:MAG: hypothetical protein C0621_01900 [Desulfuromonas sp.]|nr:MAG: hypothetical protein C0621_01900 [Desulfuromonas sp.]